MSLPASIPQRELVVNYVKEAVKNLKDQDLLKLRLKEIKDSVKESELIEPKDFVLLVKAAYDLQKLQEEVDIKSEAIANLETLGL